MEFDEFFENKRKHHGNYNKNIYHDENNHSHFSHHSGQGYGDRLNLMPVLAKIRSNNKLKLIVVVSVVLIFAMILILIIILMPLIINVFNYISTNGLQGIQESITGFLDKIWKGSGK